MFAPGNDYKNAPLSAIIKQLEFCNYESESGPLKNNIAFIELKRRAENPTNKVRLVQKDNRSNVAFEHEYTEHEFKDLRVLVLKNNITEEELENLQQQWNKAVKQTTKQKIIVVPPEFAMDEYSFELEKD